MEAIVQANHRATGGDAEAGIHPGDFEAELPLAALTCIDARLNAFFPGILGLPKERFIWLRNAGNHISAPLSSTMRSLALACAIKGAKEIAIIGHTDCQVAKTSAASLLQAFQALGVERTRLPDNLSEFFGLFASERQNVINAVDMARRSPLIGPKMPVHGLVVDIATGKLEWLVNGYLALEAATSAGAASVPIIGAGTVLHGMKDLAAFDLGQMKFPDVKIGEIGSVAAKPPPATAQPDLVKSRTAPDAPPVLKSKFQLPAKRPGYDGRGGSRR